MSLAFVVLMFGLPFLLASAGEINWTTVVVVTPPWWFYFSGALAAIWRYDQKFWSSDYDYKPLLYAAGSWFGWRRLGRFPDMFE